jgi:type III secretion protein I
MDILTAQLVLPPPAPLDAPRVVPAADTQATTRFAEIMAGDARPTPVAEAVDQAYPPLPIENRTIGDSILSGLQNMSSDFRQSWAAVHAALDRGPTMTITEMLKMQMGLTQMSIQYDLVGKAISRSTQNLDQLVKLQ